jgi:hypothetical protein
MKRLAYVEKYLQFTALRSARAPRLEPSGALPLEIVLRSRSECHWSAKGALRSATFAEH